MLFLYFASILITDGLTGPSSVEVHQNTVTVSPSTVTVVLGRTQQFTSNTAGVKWSASAGSISTSGLFTAPTTMPNSTTVIIHAAVSNRTVSATVTLAKES